MFEDVYELHSSGLIDLMARETVPEDEADRQARQMEPDAFALTYEEGRTTMWAYNIFDAVIVLNGFIETDATTGNRVRVINPESTEKILDEFTARGLDPDALYSLADRVLSGNWFTLLLSTNYQPDDDHDFGFSLVARVDGNRDEGILKIEDYPAIYEPGISRTEIRESLGLPENAKFLYSTEWDVLEILRTVCNPQPVIEEKIGFLSPYSPMPNAPALLFVARIINNIKPRQYPPTSTAESIRFFASSSTNEVKIVHETRNSRETVTLTNPEILTGRRRGETRSIFSVWAFVLQKLMQQSSRNSLPDYVQIDLQEMVNLKMYSSVDNAYRAIVSMVQKTGTMHISQDFKTGKRKKRNVGGLLFTSHVRDDYKAKVYINKLFGFEYYARQYFYFPGWCYQLNETSFPVAYYVFSLARQNAVNLTDKGKFEIKLSTLHTFLGLRTVDDVREHGNYRYNEYIKSPIIQAVDEINAAAKKDKTIKGKFKLALKVPESGSIESWLEGSIVVSAGGEYIEHLESIAEYQTLRTEAFQDAQKEKKRQKVIAAAQAAAEKN